MIRTWKIKIPSLSGSEQRLVYIYLPDDYQTSGKRYPVLYMFDGHNIFFDTHATYGKSWGMGEYLDNNKKQLILVAVECSHKGHQRLSEYSPVDFSFADTGLIQGRGKEYMDWLVDTLKPYIDSNYRTLSDRKYTIIAGSSMGGLMALYGATVYNHIFQRGACLSPSLWVAPGKVLEMVARAHIRRDTTIYMDYGELEMFNHVATQESMIATAHLLLTKRVNLAFRIVPGGNHSEASWEKQIPIFMECLGL